jgi:hypothetical protein
MSRYYDRSGKPMTMTDWAEKFDDFDYRRVALTRLEGGEVSTVWLGLNHRFGDGTPLIFETMVFGGKMDQECNRYSNEQDAIRGHQEMVNKVKVL